MTRLAEDIALMKRIAELVRMIVSNPALRAGAVTFDDLRRKVAEVRATPREYRLIDLVAVILIDATEQMMMARLDGDRVNEARFAFYAERALRDVEIDLVNAEKSMGQ